KIINILELNNKKTSILFTSSIHSDSSSNFYGKTKKNQRALFKNMLQRILQDATFTSFHMFLVKDASQIIIQLSQPGFTIALKI
ncbi:hypothetical protein N9H67_01995, partial [Methylophilaceae bacterium]|nr:hypothetical protein [Methylophilaceae bacterium]